jgi:AMMECR1 domain-containing protein
MAARLKALETEHVLLCLPASETARSTTTGVVPAEIAALLPGECAGEEARQYRDALAVDGWQGVVTAFTAPSPAQFPTRLLARILMQREEVFAVLAVGFIPGSAGEAEKRLQALFERGILTDLVAAKSEGAPVQIRFVLGFSEETPRLLGKEEQPSLAMTGGGLLVAAEVLRSSTVAGFARAALRHFLRGGAFSELIVPGAPLLQKPSACFVTIRKDGEMRGSAGTLSPTRGTLAEEIRFNTLAAATQGAYPVLKEELSLLSLYVDIPERPQQITDTTGLDPTTYGLILRCRGRLGIALPAFTEMSPELQYELAAGQARLQPGDAVELWCFTTTRYGE